jgi:large subunit ribosomal protein L10
VLRSRKEEIVDKLSEELPKAQSIIVTNHSGIGVNTINELRSDFRSRDVHYHVIKNTLGRLAVEGTDAEPVAELFRYPTAVAYSFEDPVAPAEVALDFAEDHEEYEIKGGFMDGEVLDRDGVEELSEMPTLEEVQARIVNALRHAPKRFVNLLENPSRRLAGILRAHGDQ